MKSIILIVIIFVVCVAGCAAQTEKGLFQAEYIEFKGDTALNKGLTVLEVSPINNIITWRWGGNTSMPFFVTGTRREPYTDVFIVTAKSDTLADMELYYHSGQLLGGKIYQKVYKDNRWRYTTTEFSRTNPK